VLQVILQHAPHITDSITDLLERILAFDPSLRASPKIMPTGKD
jgi:hypothetical protein